MNSQCSIELLESALEGNLPADEEAALHRHLEECKECGAALERMAGGPAWCQEVASMLPEDELDEAIPLRNDWSEVDFTVEHLEPSDEPNVLGRLGGYDVLEIIGRGGMGVVLKGFDRELKRCVAIKVLAPHLARSSLAKKRFAREAQAAAAIVHPNVLAIHQVQPNGRLPFLVMPLVAGESLAERLTARGTLELKETLRIGIQAAAGLAAAHEQGLVHRDVKPANILLEKGVERAVLTDFGLARAADDVALTRWGIIAGTPQYMSPEQARGEALDARSDLFSLGCVLYEMATGVSPFRTDSMMATLRRLVDDAPQAMGSLNPELPPWFIAIVDRLLEKDPSRRFNSAKEVSELLEGCLAHVQQPANVPLPVALPKPVPQPVSGRRKYRFKAVLALFAILGIGWLGKFVFLLLEPPDIAGAAVGIETSTVEAGRALIKGKIDASHELVVRIDWGDKPIEWRSSRPGGGEFEVVVEASDKIRLEGGKTGHGFVVTTTILTSSDVTYVPCGGDLAGTFAIRRQADFVTRNGVLTFADVTLKDGKKLPVSLRLAHLLRTRSSDNTNAPPTTTKPVAPKAQPEHPETTNDMPKRVHHFPTGASVKTIAHSADGKRIAIANGNPTFPLKDHWKRSVKILDAGTGTTVVSLKLTTDEEDAVLAATQAQFTVGPLEFSPDGKVVAVGNSIGQVKLFDARTGELVRLLDDEKAKLAEKTTSEKFNALKRAMGKVASLAFSPDGSLLAMCGSSFEDAERSWGGVQGLGELATGPGRLKVWEVNTGAIKHDLVGHSQANAVSFSPDGNWLASAGNWLTDRENGTGVIIWKPQTGTKIRTITNNDNGGTHAVAFSPNSKLVVIGSRIFDKDNDSSTTNVSLAHVGTGIMEWRQTVSGWANPKAFSPDGKRVVVLCSGQSIRFFETETGTVKHEIRSTDFPQAARWNDFALPPQGHMLAIGGTNLEGRGFVAVWDLDGPGAAASSAPGKDGENQDVKQGTTKSSGTNAQNDAVPERFETSILNDDVRWDARGLKGPFDILSATFDPSSRQITWTLRATPRHGPAFDFHAVLYDTHGQVVIEDAPLSWATGRREDGTVHLASLDVRWLARRVADSAPQVASAVIERHPDGALGRTRQINQEEVRKRTPEKLATGILPDDAIWRHDGFRSNSEALEVTFDPAAGKVTWVLEALPRTYQGRSFRVSFYDRAGNVVGPGAPLIWSSGKRDNHPVELAVLDLAYFVELLGDRARDVSTVAVERIGEP